MSGAGSAWTLEKDDRADNTFILTVVNEKKAQPSPKPTDETTPSLSPSVEPSPSPTTEPTVVPVPSDDPTPTPSEQPTVSPTRSASPSLTASADNKDDKLIQTGQVNWPIPVLIILGAALVAIGVWFTKKDKNKQR